MTVVLALTTMACCGPLVEEQLFRSVEGQAASDEEDDKWTDDQQRQVDEVKRILTRLSCCGERYRTFLAEPDLKAGHTAHGSCCL